MRILFKNHDIILSCTKKLASISALSLSAVRSAFAKRAGYGDWHELEQSGHSPFGGCLFDVLSLKEIANFIANISTDLEIFAGDVQYVLSKTAILSSAYYSLQDQLQLRALVFREMEIPDLGRRQPGSVGKFKYDGEPLILRQFGAPTYCMSHGSTDMGVADFEFITPRVSIPLFIPRRLYYPYGFWTEADGSRVLFSRDYVPLWRHRADGSQERADPFEWVKWVAQDWLWGEGNTPWQKKMRPEVEAERLAKLGIVHLPKLVEVFPRLLFDMKGRRVKAALHETFGRDEAA